MTRLRVALALSDGVGSERAEAADGLAAELGGAMKVVACWRAPPAALLLRAWRAICVRAANTRRALRRVDARAAGVALSAWGCVARAQGRLRRVGRRVVARLLARAARVGFARWRDAAAVLARMRYP